MPLIQWLTKWMFRGAFFFAFFALFAFALNNPHEVAVFFFFGTVWRTTVVMLVLVVFAAGLVLGVLAMVPRWWRERRAAPVAPTATTEAAKSVNAIASANELRSNKANPHTPGGHGSPPSVSPHLGARNAH